MHDYLPNVFILRGRRLLYSHGIYALTGFTAVILILFRGVTDRLIPLYAIGAFLAVLDGYTLADLIKPQRALASLLLLDQHAASAPYA